MPKRFNSENVDFAIASRQDAVELVAFHNSYYGHKRKPEHWLWEYQTNEPDKGFVLIARYHGKLIATLGRIPMYLEIGSDCVLTAKGENVLVLPEYRGCRVMAKLYEYGINPCIEGGIQLLWGITATAAPVFKKIRSLVFPGPVFMIRPGNLRADIASIMAGKTSWWIKSTLIAKSIFNSIFLRGHIPDISGSEYAGYRVLERTRCNEDDLKALYARLREKYGHLIALRLDHKYLNWRIREHPFFKYDEYQVYQGNQLRAYAFVTSSKARISITDLTSEDNNATLLLLHTILTNYKQAGRFIFLYNPSDLVGQSVFAQLQRFGFRQSGNMGSLLLAFLTLAKSEFILDMRNWHINGLWTEGYAM
jgi:hypothetical protein